MDGDSMTGEAIANRQLRIVDCGSSINGSSIADCRLTDRRLRIHGLTIGDWRLIG
jgi:hypothetical protein